MDSACLQVIQNLGFVDGFEADACLQLDQNTFLHDNIREIISHHNALVLNLEGNFLLATKPHLPQFDHQRVRIHFFEESHAQPIGNLKRSLKNLLCQLLLRVYRAF